MALMGTKTRFDGVLAEQPPVADVDPGHYRRFVIGELAVIGQAATETLKNIEHAAQP